MLTTHFNVITNSVMNLRKPSPLSGQHKDSEFITYRLLFASKNLQKHPQLPSLSLTPALLSHPINKLRAPDGQR